MLLHNIAHINSPKILGTRYTLMSSAGFPYFQKCYARKSIAQKNTYFMEAILCVYRISKRMMKIHFHYFFFHYNSHAPTDFIFQIMLGIFSKISVSEVNTRHILEIAG